MIFRETQTKYVGFVSVNFVYQSAQFAVPKRRHASRVATDDDKVVCDAHTPDESFLYPDMSQTFSIVEVQMKFTLKWSVRPRDRRLTA